VEFASFSDPSLVSGKVASVLGIKEQKDHSAIDMLVNHLKSRNVLLIFDHCEHLLRRGIARRCS